MQGGRVGTAEAIRISSKNYLSERRHPYGQSDPVPLESLRLTKLCALANGTGRGDAAPTESTFPGRGRVLAARMVTHNDALRFGRVLAARIIRQPR